MIDQSTVLAAAREAFVTKGRIEVGELAQTVGVNRSTIYRRFNGRDGLLAEVIWAMAELALDTAHRRAAGAGPTKIANTLGEFAAIANRDASFRGFLAREPERAFKVMTTWGGGVQPRIVGKVSEFLDERVDAGELAPSLPIDDLALILVRITETFVYANLITGEEPDAVKVRQACAAMLGAPTGGTGFRKAS
ncbi:QsdR family transcriptional regulator [Gordonia phthalatica]|uniref:TetR family transcriptional regulator n=1 Tax=Gordonia phthalatica TaxID=1136941 RepID=A0A0N9NCW2_9ACTN|nr:QsdR family transcriptional regulator [Gordonia phthalatica]ALG85510.1 TetR family transcriptional regulator [Gordonia phthalatica]